MRPTVISRRRCEPPAPAAAIAPEMGRAKTLGLLRPPQWLGMGGERGVPAWPGGVPTGGTALPPGHSHLPPILAWFLLPATLRMRVRRGHTHPTTTHRPPHHHAHPTDHACTLPPRGRTRRRGCQIFVLFLPGCFFTPCTVCTRAATPQGRAALALPPQPPPGVPWPPPPSPPHRPPPHGAGAVVVGNKSSLSVVPWGCGRRLVLRVGGPAGGEGGGGCHPLGSPSLSAPSLLGLCPRRILLAGAEPAPTRCLANERLITGAKSSKLHGN